MLRAVVPVVLGSFLFVGLVGCGGQAGFAKDFVEQYCDAHDACDRLGRPCPVELDENGLVFKDCDFDKDLAEECLAATYSCNDSIPENAVVVVPEACVRVCGDGIPLPGTE